MAGRKYKSDVKNRKISVKLSEAVYAVHTDKEHMHAHLIWNSVSLVTGKKYNSPKENWKKHLQPITNKYCKKLGLGICPAENCKISKLFITATSTCCWWRMNT